MLVFNPNQLGIRPTVAGNFLMIRRREFIAGLGGAAAWPFAVRAQQPAMPVIGYLSSFPADTNPKFAQAFREGLNDAGFVEGRNVAIEYRFEFVINLKTAKGLGVKFSDNLMSLADEVIE
jgi:hypothetical protein